MDVVYILGNGSKWGDNEIKYSMRTLKNMKHDKVHVIGKKCKWFSDKVNHIPADDIYGHKQLNAQYKLKVACDSNNISDDFILMNDDFFILREYKPEYYYRSKMKDFEHPTKRGNYYTAYLSTLDLVGGDALEYEHHSPFVFNKKKLKKILVKYNKPLWIRTMYGNMYSVGGTQKEDVKARSVGELNKLIKEPQISTDDLVVQSTSFTSVTGLFPNKSIYELTNI